ncbi:hypothetical protein [Pseudomonas abieticivorans]|uniref:hypothetical protein n=1 Tax=Pseudomonas abieticivorans TaxID=2931382 RepID=UPI0020BF71A0|nr:hypothetical protein [Pseudomonas sp. PIA16]
MPFDQISWSIGSSLFFIVLYLVRSMLYRCKPDLTHAVIIAMSCSSVVAAISLGTLTYLSVPEDLGVLRGQKASILIGALVMTWASAMSAYSSVMHPARRARLSLLP